ILSLRDDAFEPHLASMGEDGRAVTFDVLVEPDAGTGLSQDRRALAELKRIAPQVVAIELDQVERPHEHVRITASAGNNSLTHRLSLMGYKQKAGKTIRCVLLSQQPQRHCYSLKRLWPGTLLQMAIKRQWNRSKVRRKFSRLK